MSDIISKLYKMKKNEVAMMQQRGMNLKNSFLIKGSQQIPFDASIFLSPSFKYANFLKLRQDEGLFLIREDFSCIYHDQNNKPWAVVYLASSEDNKPVNTTTFNTQVRKLITTMKYHNFLLISEKGISAGIIGYFTERSSGYHFEEYLDIAFAVNPTKHAFSPIKTTYIPPEDTKAFIKEEGLKSLSSLPLVRIDDPLARYHGARSHGLIMTELVGSIYDKTVFYRAVV
jgi:hypothetical protein